MIDFSQEFRRDYPAGLLTDDLRGGKLQDGLCTIIESCNFALIV